MAYFTDEASIEDNSIQTGELDLEVGSSSSIPVNVSGVAPSESGSGTIPVYNSGNIDGHLSVEVNVTGYNTNNAGSNEPHYDLSGELRDELQIEVGFDGETVIEQGSIGTADLMGEVPSYNTISSASNLYVDWEVDEDATDEVQTDVIEFEVVVRADQTPPVEVSSTSELRTALDDASPGEVIRLADGDFNINEPLIVDTPAVTLHPQQGADPTIDANGSETPAAVDISADDVRFDGIDVHQNGSGGKCVEINDTPDQSSNSETYLSGVTVSNLEIRNASQRGMTAQRCEEIVYKNIHTEDQQNSGLELWYTDNSRIEGVTAVDNGDNGIYVNGANVSILNCEASGNADQGVDFSIYDNVTNNIDSSNGMLVDNVYSHGNENGGIELHDDSDNQDDPANSKLVKNCRTENNNWESQSGQQSGSAGLVLNQVDEDEVQVVNSYFSEGIKSATGTDLDP